MARLRDRYDEENLAKILRHARPPTNDDVSITNDGRRLDSAEAVVEFFDELRRERERTDAAE